MSGSIRMGRLLALPLALMLAGVSPAQQRDDFIRPFFGYYNSQSLSSAIGNATVAAGQIIPGRSSNPANLGLSRFRNIQLNFQHNSFAGRGASASNTSMGGLYAVLPVPVYQGSLVFGLGVDRVVDFTNAYDSPTRQATEEGGIYATQFGMAVEAAQNVFIGGALDVFSGSDELSISESDSNRYLNPYFGGLGLTLGFVNRASAHVQIGGSFQFAQRISVDDRLSTWHIDAPESSQTRTWEYRLHRPLTFHLGFSLLYPLWSFMYEMEWADWSGLKFRSDSYFAGDVNEINREIARDFHATLTHHLGGAAHLPWLPLHIYAGYQYLPVPFKGEYGDDRRQSASFGASYLLSQQFSLHGSFTNYFWKYQGERENDGIVLFGVSFHS